MFVPSLTVRSGVSTLSLKNTPLLFLAKPPPPPHLNLQPVRSPSLLGNPPFYIGILVFREPPSSIEIGFFNEPLCY